MVRAGAQSAAYCASWVNSSWAMAGRHLRTVCWSAARKGRESNSSTVSGRPVKGRAWLPARRTSTTSAQTSRTSGGGGAACSVKATSNRSNSTAARRMRVYMGTGPPGGSGKGGGGGGGGGRGGVGEATNHEVDPTGGGAHEVVEGRGAAVGEREGEVGAGH